jgi:hypothetical protein
MEPAGSLYNTRTHTLADTRSLFKNPPTLTNASERLLRSSLRSVLPSFPWVLCRSVTDHLCLHRSLFFPTNRFYGHEMGFGLFDLATYELVIAFALAFHARPQAVETVENCSRESFMQIPETTEGCMHNWFLALPGLQILVHQTLEKVMSESWASGRLTVIVKLKSTA